MSDTHGNRAYGDAPLDPVAEIERLATRIADGEATDDQLARFEQLAAAEPSWWRHLALDQHAVTMLSRQVDRRLATADAVETPDAPARRSSRPLAWSGWAAGILLAVAWLLSARLGGTRLPGDPAVRPAVDSPSTLSPDEHLRAYLEAPFVLGELDPILLQVDDLTDGRTALRFLRRIEEVAIVDDPESIPADDDGRLLVTPSDLRGGVPGGTRED